MSSNDFSVGGRHFKMSKMDAFKQFHVVRRVAPILSDILPALKGAEKYKDVKDIEQLSEDQHWELVAKVAKPLMDGFGKLPDADADLVLHGLLSCVEVQQATGNWARVSSNGMLMMQDMELPLLLQIAGRAFMFNLGGFFAALPQ